MLARVYGISDPVTVGGLTYATGLTAAVSVALSYGIQGIAPRDAPPPVPRQLLDQAGNAYRSGVSLETVLRRYFAGYALFGDFMVEEADQIERFSLAQLRRLLQAATAVFDGIVLAVGEEYAREAADHPQSTAPRRAACVRGLLAGELLDPGELSYELDAWHLAAVASGPGAIEGLKALAAATCSRLLLVRSDDCRAWAWFGGSRKTDLPVVLALAGANWPAGSRLSFGEAGVGIDGWRRSHHQALAAMTVADRGGGEIVSYADVSLLATALHDDLLADFLRDCYLAPLAQGRDGGEALRKTLRAYFASGRNVSAAAAVLRVSRTTVASRLRAVEEVLDRTLESCTAELETALCLEGLTAGGSARARIETASTI